MDTIVYDYRTLTIYRNPKLPYSGDQVLTRTSHCACRWQRATAAHKGRQTRESQGFPLGTIYRNRLNSSQNPPPIEWSDKRAKKYVAYDGTKAASAFDAYLVRKEEKKSKNGTK